MTRARVFVFLISLQLLATHAQADTPAVQYIFPAGGQRGTKVDVRIGALDLSKKASFEILGSGVSASRQVERTETTWLEGPVLLTPESVQIEDYPKDYSGRITIDASAPLGPRAWRVWNSEGASGSLPFIVGEFREVVEVEREESGNPQVVHVSLPVTANGRIFPREDVDLWRFTAKAGEIISARAEVARLDSKLEPWLEAIGPDGKAIIDARRSGGGDPRLEFVAPMNGTYTIKVLDLGNMGSQWHVYRLTLTKGPRIDSIYPLGGRRGSLVSFLAEGSGVPGKALAISLPELTGIKLPSTVAVQIPGVGPASVDIDDLSETLEAEANETAETATKLTVPGVGNGSIGKPGDVDTWAVALTAGKLYKFEVRAAWLGSNLDPVIKIVDREGKIKGSSEGTSESTPDPELTLKAAETGVVFVRIQDRFRSRGGHGWGYRLRVTEESSPDFSLAMDTDTLSLVRDSSAKLKIHAIRNGGFTGPIELEFEGLPEGVTASKTTIDAKSKSAEITFKANKKAPIRSTRLTVRGTAKIDSKQCTRTAVRPGSDRIPEIDTVRVAVGLKPPFVLTGPIDFSASPRGTVHHHVFQIKAEGIIGPIEVRIADRQIRHLQGVTGPVLMVPNGVKEFDYPVTLPPWMETGRTSRAVICTTGTLREPDGTEHEVSHSWPDNVHQFVTVVGPGLMTIQTTSAMITLGPRRSVDIPVKLTRGKGIQGPVRVELVLPWSVRGLSAEPLTFSPDQLAGTMRLNCDSNFESPPSAVLNLNASSTGPVGNDPVTAQASLTILSESSATASKLARSSR